MTSVERVRLIYVVGMGRSGSTLLDILLGRLHDVIGVGEFINFTDWIRADDKCACGEPLSQCSLWKSVLHACPDARDGTVAFGRGLRPTLAPALRALFVGRPAAASSSSAQLNRDLLAAARTASGAAIVVDSSKNVGRLCELEMSGLFDIHVVHLVRDARGVMWSKMKSLRRMAEETPEMLPALARHPEYADRRSPWLIMRQWVVKNALILVLGWARWRSRYRVLRYEDLAAAPDETIRSLAAWVGAAYEPVDEPDVRVPHNVGGNRMRLRPVKGIRVDDEWRSKMGLQGKLAYILLGGPIVSGIVSLLATRPPTTSARIEP